MKAMNALLLHDKDNVAVSFYEGAKARDAISITDRRGETARIILAEPVPYGHKVAVAPIRKGEMVIKYGEIIGRATEDIAAGCHVHVHNMESLRARGDLEGK